MNRNTFFHWMGGFFLIGTLAACNTVNSIVSKTMPERGVYMGSTGEGSVGSASWSGHKCQAILDWLETFQQDFPDIDIAYMPGPYGNLPTVAHLFIDRNFEPVFGVTYNVTHRETLKGINSNVIGSCMGWGKYAAPFYAKKFGPRKLFFDRTFARVQPQLVAEINKLKAHEAWRQQTIADLDHIPLTQSGFATLTNDIIPEGQRHIGPLRPGDLEAFRTITAAKKKEIARAVLDRDFPDLESLPPTLETAQLIAKAFPYLEAVTSDHPYLARDMALKRDNILNQELSSWQDRLNKIPMTVEGRGLNAQWVREFEAAFHEFGHTAELLNLSRAWRDQRERIYQATPRRLFRKTRHPANRPRCQSRT